MDKDKIIEELKNYEDSFESILSHFTRDRDGIHIARKDDPLFRQHVRELIDLFDEIFGQNRYSLEIAREANEGVSNFLGSPSYKSVENILALVRAVLTKLKRDSGVRDRKRAEDVLRCRENIFIIHGRDEAKWRELKGILRDELRLNPIILTEQPDAGCRTIIEKFEHYAQTCSYAIALFTPDDEVTSGKDIYLQARPNAIYELGWFCGRLGRSGAMLLLKNGTSMFTDFGGIIQKRFAQDVSEKTVEIRRDLIAAGVLDDA